jgi:hypothetical protein
MVTDRYTGFPARTMPISRPTIFSQTLTQKMARIIFTLEDGTEIRTELDTDVIAIGRHPESNVVLPSPSVSAHHATIRRRGDSYFVQDLGTTNGTRLNGVEVEEAKLEDGDRLAFGDIPAVLQLKDAPVVPIVPVPKRSGGPPKQAVKPRGAPRPGARRSYSTATYRQSSGCAGFIAILTFLLVAFTVGIILAHYVKYHRFLLPDVVNSEPVKKLLGNDSEAPAKSEAKDGDKAKN